MNRTQIYLPEDLRKEIDHERATTGESLSQYMRQAAEVAVERDKKRMIDLKKLAQEVVGSSTRSKPEALEWVKQIREDRRLADEKWEKRWKKAKRKIGQDKSNSQNSSQTTKYGKSQYLPA